MSPPIGTQAPVDLNKEDQNVLPVQQNQRQLSLDFIRGIAIFGILIMNIQAFGNVFASYGNPTVNGDFTGVNVFSWFVTYIFFEQKFYTLFSMLFGAGIVLLAEKASAKGISPVGLHYRRSFILVLFGLVHGFFIWYGDILLTYGLFAFVVYFGWKSRPRNLIALGIILTLIVSVIMFSTTGDSAPDDMVLEMQENFLPDPAVVQERVNAYLGGWDELHTERVRMMGIMIGFITVYGIRIAGCMLIGMALFKLGIINGKRSIDFYKKLALACLIPGFAMVGIGAYLVYQSGFVDAIVVQGIYGQLNFLGSLLVAIGYIGVFQIIHKRARAKSKRLRFEAVGQMAFTNYISQSLICTFIFYGFGLAMFGALSRYEMILLAIAVYALQLLWSKWWLDHFYFGPLEWLWRSLTYFKPQPFRR